MGVIAIDWSGARTGARRAIYRARVCDDGVDVLSNGLGREQVADWLSDQAQADAELVVGLDFCFSLPAWYLHREGFGSAEELWGSSRPREWLRRSPWPFWGHAGSRRPTGIEHYRRTEQRVPAVAGVRPKSVFQIGGAGAVGTGTLRGLPILRRLHQRGFGIWPFHPQLPRVVEIYPRLLTGPVRKTRAPERRDRLAGERIPPHLSSRAQASDDAFDAALSALAMDAHAAQLRALPTPADPLAAVEGWIWNPEPRP